jgi:DNA (cytosine-5)-methyltransferase 1
MVAPLKNGPWNLVDLKSISKNGFKVFSCFHCAGGSSMGYKLAGYDVLGGVEIDKKMMEIYKINHHPKYSYLMGVQDFKNIPNKELPEELFNLDILDGSPPCSSFSIAGKREKSWGKKKYFREGQESQILDDLFFSFINIAEKLKPKIVVSENVKGLILGNAKGYVKQILERFDCAGYDTQLFLLNSCKMGVPQSRERVFFISKRKDLNFNKLKLDFNETVILSAEALKECRIGFHLKLDTAIKQVWHKLKPGDSVMKLGLYGFHRRKLDPHKPSKTQAALFPLIHWKEPRHLYSSEIFRLQTFPDDFDVEGKLGHYICGMSVPPYMMQRIATQIEIQWLSNTLNKSVG